MDFSVWVTNACNLSCKYCYVNEAKGAQYIDSAFIDKFADFINSVKDQDEDFRLNLFGGEPLLALNQIKSLLFAINEKVRVKPRVLMTSNGITLNEEIIEFIKEQQIELSISIDGCREANDINRLDKNGNSTYDIVIQKIKLLSRSGMDKLRIRATFNHNSVKLLKKSIYTLLNENPAADYFFAPDIFDPNWEMEDFSIVEEVCNNLKNKKINNVRVVGNNELVNAQCTGGQKSFHVYVDGRIFPCSATVGREEFCIGSLEYGIESSKLSSILNHNTEEIRECLDCNNRNYCMTNKCRIINYLLCGEYNVPSPIVCQFENIRVRNCFRE